MVQLEELENTLFGVVLKCGSSNHEFKPERSVHISMAALDTSVPSSESVQVFVGNSETNKFLMCTLNSKNVLQQQIALELNAHESVTFSLGGQKGSVHLTGLYINEQRAGALPLGEEDGEEMPNLSRKEMEEYLKQVNADYFENEDMEGDSDDDSDDVEGDDSDDVEGDSDDVDGDSEELEGDSDDEEDDEEDDDEEDEPTNGKKRKLEVEAPKKAEKPKKGEQPKKVEQPPKKGKKEEKAPQLVPAKSEKFESKTIQGGVQIKDIKEGTGPVAKKGKFVSVYYCGKLKSNGKQFDKCIGGKPFKFRLGSGEVIKGWDVGFENMKVGGKRSIVVPPSMGYGQQRMGKDIPPGSTLMFDVELKAVS